MAIDLHAGTHSSPLSSSLPAVRPNRDLHMFEDRVMARFKAQLGRGVLDALFPRLQLKRIKGDCAIWSLPIQPGEDQQKYADELAYICTAEDPAVAHAKFVKRSAVQIPPKAKTEDPGIRLKVTVPPSLAPEPAPLRPAGPPILTPTQQALVAAWKEVVNRYDFYLASRNLSYGRCHMLKPVEMPNENIVTMDIPADSLGSACEVHALALLEFWRQVQPEIEKLILRVIPSAKAPLLRLKQQDLLVAIDATTSVRDSIGSLFDDAEEKRMERIRALGDEPPEFRIRIEDIQRIVARHYNVSRLELVSKRRTRYIVKPRQIAMYLCKTLTPRSFPEIGRRFGGRDHTTVLHAVRKIEAMLADRQFQLHIKTLIAAIYAYCAPQETERGAEEVSEVLCEEAAT